MMRKLTILLVVVFCVTKGFSQFKVETQTIQYKKVDGISLEMDVYKPVGLENEKLPVIVFFFGGGWVGGTIKHFEPQANYLASRGIVAICPEYRIKSKHQTTPFECVKDAKSAIRYIKENADELGIDPDKIITSGGSAGGHLAACTALINRVNEETDNLNISTMPLGLILFNPVIDTSKKGFGQKKMEGREFEISPVHHVTCDLPYTLIMHGKDDTTVPYENVERFKHTMKQCCNKCKLVGFKGQGHSFFNLGKSPKGFKKTLQLTEKYLESFDFLKGKSWLNSYVKNLSN